MKKPSRVIILGGGLTGLAAAWKLSGAGADVVVIEALDHVGGLAASFSWRGVSLDIGPHKLYPRIEGIQPLLESLLGDDLVKHKKRAAIWLQGRPIDWPPNLRSGLGNLSLSLKSMASHIGDSMGRQAGPDATYEDYMTARFGPYMFKHILGPQANKIWGPPDGLAAELGRIRMSVPNLLEAWLGTILKGRRGPSVSAKEFYYPKEGIGRLSDRLALEIAAHGGRILLGRKPTAVGLSNRGVEVRLGDESFPAEVVVSTIPIDSLLEIVDPRPPAEIAASAAKLRFRSLILCYLALSKPRMSRNQWIVFPEDSYCFNRVYEAKAFGVIGRADETVVAAEITVDSKNLSAQSDDEISNRVIADLARTGLIKAADALACKVIRVNRAYPLLDLGYDRHRQRALDYLHAQPNILSAGRSGLFVYNNMDHSLAMGLAAAENILLGAVGSWPEEALAFEHPRIID